MGRIATFGWLAPRIQHTGTSLDFTPTKGWVNLTPADMDDRNIKRTAIITDEAKVIVKGQYPKQEYLFQHLTLAEIGAFININGETITLTPHSDYPGISFTCLVSNINIDDNDPRNVDVYISLITQDYDNAHKYITVTSPNGSELLQRNQSVTITWSSAFITGNIAIELWKNDVKLSDIDTDDANDGSYTWSVASDAVIDTDYQIKIIDVNTGLVYDLSDGDFSILYDGYFGFSGSRQDYIQLPFSTITGNTKTFGFEYKRTALNTENEYIIYSITGAYEYEYININKTTSVIEYRLVTDGNTTIIRSSNAIVANGAWHSVYVSIDHLNATANNRVKIYHDLVDVTTVVDADNSTPYAGTDNYKIGLNTFPAGHSFGIDTVQIKRVGFYNTTMTLAQITSQLSAPLMTNAKAFYFGNEAIGALTDPSGLGNGTDIYVDSGVASNTITSLEIDFGNFTNTGNFGAQDVVFIGNRFTITHSHTANTITIGFGSASLAAIYDVDKTHRFTLSIAIAGGNYTITLYDQTSSGFITVSAGSATGATGTITSKTFKMLCYDNNGTNAEFSVSSLYSFTINTQKWFVRPATSTTIKSNLGTSLTVNGTLTSFWVNDEPYGAIALDSSGNDYHGTPTAIIPSIWFNQS